MNKLHEWVNTGLIVLVAILVLVGGNQSDQTLGASGTRFPNGISADTTSPIAGEVRGTSSTITATSTVGSSPDGFILWDDYTISTTTPVRATLTNNGSPLMCDGDTLAVYSDAQAAFIPSYYFVIGTSTSAAYSANLVASTTVATSTSATASDAIQSPATTWPFLLPSGSSITLSVGDTQSTVSSSTYYSSWAGELSVHCWTIGQ